MPDDSPIPVAQYLRMSTEHQRYSFENQSAGIQKYCESMGFSIIRTYFDAAKSGVVLKSRTGLRLLLRDVVSGNSEFKAVVVYDVSRWGRFQDIDESAHYEFLCKSAGVAIHYCAESFLNDGAFPNVMMKVLKRAMAGEYSRELGIKVLAGQKRLANIGFKQGGTPGYGLRRMLLSRDRQPKQLLACRERKSIATDRVVLVPGSIDEIEVVRDIYDMLISRKLSVSAIARDLNRRGVQYLENSSWDHQAVHSVLTHPKYAGIHVFGRTSKRLFTPFRRVPQSQWVVTPGAFNAIVDQVTFEKAQSILQSRTIHRSDEEVLESLKRLLAREGKLSLRLIKGCSELPSPSTFRARFGGLRQAYALVGYDRQGQFDAIELRRRTQALRNALMGRIAEMFPDEISIIRCAGKRRSVLCWRQGTRISVVVARSIQVWKQSIRWLIELVPQECNNTTLLARTDEANHSLMDLYLLRHIGKMRFRIRRDDAWLQKGLRLNENLSDFCESVREIHNN